MRRIACLGALFLTIATVAASQPSLPAGLTSRTIATPDGAQIYVRYGGSGPVVLLIHGFGDTGEMWGPVVRDLEKSHTVVVPDLRGMGRSSHPEDGYDKRTQAADLRAVMTTLGYDHSAVVGHDIGNMVAYAYTARYPDKVERLVVIDAPLPGIDPWDEVKCSPQTWHFNFRGPDVERLVKGRERILLDRFYNELSAHPKKIDEETRSHYAKLYARPHAMHDAFEQFGAFSRDAIDNKALLAQGGKITMPVFAIGAEKSFGTAMADDLRFVATNVTGGIVPNSGHWIMEENPQATVKLVAEFLAK